MTLLDDHVQICHVATYYADKAYHDYRRGKVSFIVYRDALNYERYTQAQYALVLELQNGDARLIRNATTQYYSAYDLIF